MQQNLTSLWAGIVLTTFALTAAHGAKDFHDQDLTGKSFSNEVLNGADFSNANLKNVRFDGASLKGAIFKGASLDNTNFTDADLTGADLRESKGEYYAVGTDFSKTNMEGLSLRFSVNAKYVGANLKNTKITGIALGIDCTNADFSGSNFRTASVADWNNNKFKGAVFDGDTAFPKGFDPKSFGMVVEKPKEKNKDDNKEAPKVESPAPPAKKVETSSGQSRENKVDVKISDAPRPRTAPARETPLPKLEALAAKPMHVVGRAVFEDGRPIPKFTVRVLGYDGEANLFAGSLPSLGQEEGRAGEYSVLTTDTINHKKPVKGLVCGVTATAKINYKGHEYDYELHPIDGMIDGTDKNAFRGESGKGVTRDFVMKMSGVRRGCDSTEQSETLYRNAMYGGRISVDCTQSTGRYPSVEDATSLTKLFSPDSIIELKLEPTGPLLDGSSGEIIVRQFPLGKTYGNWHDHFLRSIPVGEYTATATLTEGQGAAIPLRLKLAFNGPLQASATILWAPQNGRLAEVNLFLAK